MSSKIIVLFNFNLQFEFKIKRMFTKLTSKVVGGKENIKEESPSGGQLSQEKIFKPQKPNMAL
jgi:hypothetical protein